MKFYGVVLLFVVSFIFGQPKVMAQGNKLDIQPLTEGVYLHTSYKEVDGFGLVASNGLVVVDKRAAIIVDTPWTEVDTEALLAWIIQQGFVVQASISTHSHEDRAGGIGLLNQKNVPTYASELTNRFLTEQGKATAVHVFSGSDFSLLDGQVQIFYPGEGHTKDNLVVWLPQQRLLMGGCLVRSLRGKSLGYVGEANVSAWAGSVRNIQHKFKGIQTVVPGHGEVDGVNLLEHTIALAGAAAEAAAQVSGQKASTH